MQSSTQDKDFAIGEKIGSLTITGEQCKRGGKIFYPCRCDCGDVIFRRKSFLLNELSRNMCRKCSIRLTVLNRHGKIESTRDFSGHKFGKWEVIERAGMDNRKQWLLKCRCECGVVKNIRGSRLCSGQSKQCRICSYTASMAGKIGHKYGKWNVLSIYSPKRYLCRCECGTESAVLASNLYSEKSTACSSCSYSSRKSDHYTRWWVQVNRGALSRNIPIAIGKQYAIDLLVAQNYRCALSGVEIFLNKGIKSDKTETTASLDRKDSSAGYVPGNIQWVHKDVNYMKQSYPQDYFIDFCKKIAGHTVVPARF